MSDLVQRRKAMAEEMMHDAICEAATAVLAQVGFAALTMERVAEAAGVSKGTLYNYFQDRDALMLAVIKATFAPLDAEIDEAFTAATDVAGVLVEAVRTILVEVEKRRALGLVLCGHELPPAVAADLRQRQMRVERQFTEVFQWASQAGLLRLPQASPAELGRFLRLALHGMIDERIRHGADCPTVEQDAAHLANYLIRRWFKEP
jgi:AcrR family transcriptional regulator